MRVLAIDFGERRIGLAVSDPEGRLALPLGVVERTTDRRAVHRIADVAREHEVELLVVGEPRDLSGASGDATLRARRFAEKLRRVTGLPLRMVEETLTTVEAAERLRAAGLDDERGGRRDAVAAQVLLEEALAGLRAAREGP